MVIFQQVISLERQRPRLFSMSTALSPVPGAEWGSLNVCWMNDLQMKQPSWSAINCSCGSIFIPSVWFLEPPPCPQQMCIHWETQSVLLSSGFSLRSCPSWDPLLWATSPRSSRTLGQSCITKFSGLRLQEMWLGDGYSSSYLCKDLKY